MKETTPYLTILKQSQKTPYSKSIVYMGHHLTFKQFIEHIDNFAFGLQELGVKKGDAITIVLPNIPNSAVAFYAASKLGAVAHMVHPFNPPPVIEKSMQACNSRILLLFDQLLPPHHALVGNKDITTISCSGGDYPSRHANIAPIKENVLNYNKIVTAKPKKEIKPAADAEALCCYLHSGGTTDAPKIIEIQNKALNFISTMWGEIYNFKSEEEVAAKSVLSVLPIFHSFGLGLLFHACISKGMRAVLVPKFEPDQVIDIIKTEKINIMGGVPTMYQALAMHPLFSGDAVKSIEVPIVGGDFLSPAIEDAFNKKLKDAGSCGRLFDGLGLSETAGVSTANVPWSSKKGSVGRAFANIKLRIVDLETKKLCPTGECGEVCVHSPSLMKGYLNDKKATDNAFITLDGKKFVRTGDYGHIDEDGFLFLKQRIKHIIIVSGINVYPAEIEGIVNRIQGVELSVAIGIPDERKGNVVKLFVKVRNGVTADEALTDKILKSCKGNLLPHAVPKAIAFVDNMPMTLLGKVDFTKLS